MPFIHIIFLTMLQVMLQAGVEGTELILLLEDHQFVHPAILELVNSLLSAGEVPGLYTPEEMEPVLAPLRDLMSQEGYRGTALSYFSKARQSKSTHRLDHGFFCRKLYRLLRVKPSLLYELCLPVNAGMVQAKHA